MEYQTVDATGVEKPVDFLVLTAVEVERDAVLAVMTSFSGSGHPVKTFFGKAVYYAGRIGQYRCVLLMCRAGSGGRDGSALAVHDALTAWGPRGGVVMVGIAFGRHRPRSGAKAAPKQMIGDILVATQLYPYESERVGLNNSVDRGPRPESSLILENRLRNLHWCWTPDGGSPRGLKFGPLLSGEKLVDNKALRNDLFARFPEAIGGEMEGAGVYAASSRAGVDWMIFKAICDWADGSKNKKHQGFAATKAADLLLRLLSESDLVAEQRPNTSAQGLSPNGRPSNERPLPASAAPKKAPARLRPTESPSLAPTAMASKSVTTKVLAAPNGRPSNERLPRDSAIPKRLVRTANQVFKASEIRNAGPSSGPASLLDPVATMATLARMTKNLALAAEVESIRDTLAWAGPSEPVKWLNGRRARCEDGRWLYPTGITAIWPDGTLKYPNATTARFPGGDWKYPNACSALNSDGTWRTPRAFSATKAELAAAVLRAAPGKRGLLDRIRSLSGDAFVLPFLEVVWSVLGPDADSE